MEQVFGQEPRKTAISLSFELQSSLSAQKISLPMLYNFYFMNFLIGVTIWAVDANTLKFRTRRRAARYRLAGAMKPNQSGGGDGEGDDEGNSGGGSGNGNGQSCSLNSKELCIPCIELME